MTNDVSFSDEYLRHRAEVFARVRPERAYVCRELRSETGAPHRQIKRIVKSILEGET